MPGNLLLKKKIDWSVFEFGITIPIECHKKFFSANGEYLARGLSRPIELIWNGRSVPARLNNVARQTESDTLQIKYSKGTPASEFFKAIFQRTYINILKARENGYIEGKERPHVKVPDDKAEFLYIYATTIPYVYEIECETQVGEFYYGNNKTSEKKALETEAKVSLEEENSLLNNEEINNFRIVRFNDLASKLEKPKQINRAGKIYYSSIKLKEDIKQHYNYSCQICSTQIKKAGWNANLSGVRVFRYLDADAHHVKPLSSGGPDSPFNLLCLCPNCHRRLHTGQFEVVFEDIDLPICLDVFDKTKYHIYFRDGHKLIY